MSVWQALDRSGTVPLFKLFPRAGVPAWVALSAIMSGAPVVFVWIFAFMKCPEDK